MRTVFLGSSTFAVDVLKTLAGTTHRPALVVTPPDRPKGRGRKVAPPPAAEAASELGIELVQTANVNEPEIVKRIERAAPEVICVCQFGQLIKEPLLSARLMLNVHPSLLPRWRGAAPIERALMAGDARTGVSIFRVEAGLDSGPIALARAEPVRPDDTAASLSARLAPLAGGLLIEALDRVGQGNLELTPQSEESATYARKIEPAERRLDPGKPAAELERVVRALALQIGAYVELADGEHLGVSAARMVEDRVGEGEVRVADGRLLIGSADGTLELLEVRPAGKRTMRAVDYLRGHRPASRVASA